MTNWKIAATSHDMRSCGARVEFLATSISRVITESNFEELEPSPSLVLKDATC